MPPTTSLITDFAGADENPLSEGGIWQGSLFAGQPNMQKVSQQAKPVGTGTALNVRWILNHQFPGDQECWATNISGGAIALWLRVNGAGVNATASGMMLTYLIPATWRIYEMVPTISFNPIAGPDNTAMAAGDQIWFQAVGNVYTAWHFTGGVWVQRLQVTSDVIQGSGAMGLELDNDDSLADDFGGGAPLSALQVPLIYPRPSFGPF